MPIKVQYAPPFEDVMAAAQAVGAGQFEQQRRREALAAAELAQRDLAQQRAIAADQQRQAVAIAAQQQEQAARMQMAGWEAALREQNIVRAREWGLADRDVARQQDLADRDAANQEWDRRQGVQFWDQWGLDSVDASEKQIGADLAGLLKQKQMLTQEGVNTLGKLLGKWRGIQGARASVPPDEYARILNDFAGEVERSGVYDHIKAPPSPEEIDAELERRARPRPDGSTLILQPDGKIDYRPPPKPVVDPTVEAWQKHRDSFIGKTKKVQTGTDEDGAPIEEERPYSAKEIVEMWETGQEADRLMLEKAGDQPPPITAEQAPAAPVQPPVAPPAPVEPPQPVPPPDAPALPPQPATNREAYEMLYGQLGEGQFEKRPHPGAMSNYAIDSIVKRPEIRAQMLQKGIIPPRGANEPPPPPPEVIEPTAEGAEKLRALLEKNPAGVQIRDARDGKLKFIPPPKPVEKPAKPAKKAPAPTEVSYERDGNGNISRKISRTTDEDGEQVVTVTTYERDESGNIIRSKISRESGLA